MPETLAESSRARLLLVDDVPANIQVLYQAFRSEHDVFLATSGQQALDFVAANPAPDVILLDVMMPGMDGFEVCRRLKADPITARIPVIFVTALGDFASEETGLELGAVDYLVKPVNPALARHRVNNLLERERLRREVEDQRNHLEDLVEARTLALSIAKEAADTANRAKTAFLANMGHELRTPLNGVMGIVELALRRTEDAKLKEQLARAREASRHLLAIINDVLDIAKAEAGRLSLKHKPYRLGTVVAGVASLVAPQAAAKGLALRCDCPPEFEGLTVWGDPDRLQQVLLNLAQNAVRFTVAGSVDIGVAARTEDDTRITVRVEVHDTGIGIPAADHERIFAPFEQGDGSWARRHGGTGLGLAISRHLVGLMGGAIDVVSAPGEGSTFGLTLPLSKAVSLTESPGIPGDPSALEQVRARYAGEHILVVEADPINQEVARELLDEAGLAIDVAESGLDAVELARRNEYALALLDLHLRGTDSLELARTIRALPGRGSLPLIGIGTGIADTDLRMLADSGIDDVIVSPLEGDALFALVLRWLQCHRDATPQPSARSPEPMPLRSHQPPEG